jgi:Zn-dependent protease with chaperone function
LATIILSACTTTKPKAYPGRQASEAEMRTLTQAVRPLLEELNFGIPHRPEDCRVGLLIMASAAINAGAGPGTRTPCTLFTLGVSDGAVRRLSVDMLRAMLAHELGHVRLGHFEARRARGDSASVFTRAFERAEEAEADRFAVQLLRKLEPRYPGSCIALVYVFALLTDQSGGPNPWLATHPSPERRAETARAGCEATTASRP